MYLHCSIIFFHQGICTSPDNAGSNAGKWLFWYIYHAREVSCWKSFLYIFHHATGLLNLTLTAAECCSRCGRVDSLSACVYGYNIVFSFSWSGAAVTKKSWKGLDKVCDPLWCRSGLLAHCLTTSTLLKFNLHVSPGRIGPVSDPFSFFPWLPPKVHAFWSTVIIVLWAFSNGSGLLWCCKVDAYKPAFPKPHCLC